MHPLTCLTDRSLRQELEAIKARVRDMEEEAEKLRQMQEEVEKQMNSSTTGMCVAPRPVSPLTLHLISSGAVPLSLEEKVEVDARSIYVGNVSDTVARLAPHRHCCPQVDYSATADDLERHFHGCGSVNRVTILVDKFSGHPKGFAYIEFADKDSVQTATALDESLFKGRQIKVSVPLHAG